ncbi:MAG: histidine kinase [Bacteroidetes bacterium]|nr:histidine kinase [Bacteroidota bacterium]
MKFRYFNQVNGALQLLGWLLFIGMPLIANKNRAEFWTGSSLLHYTFQHVLLVGLFYGNYFYLIPKKLELHGLGIYLVWLLCAALGIFLCLNLAALFTSGGNHPFSLRTNSIVPIVQIAAASSAWRLLADYVQFRLRELKLKTEKEQAELRFLRSQITPHFLFNTLNNIVAQIRYNPLQAEKSVVRLSQLMRYMLSSGSLNKVDLSLEIDYIRNYIALQQLRLPKEFNLSVDLPEAGNGIFIEPLLLIGFVENTFKHGVHGDEQDFIEITIRLANQKLYLHTRNRFKADSGIREIESGIGMANVKNRLELCYPGHYVLSVIQQKELYSTELQLDL